MTGTARSSADLDPRRARALFRSWHRGMREVDLILGTFADREIATLRDEDLATYEALMNEPDADILKWVTGEAPVPPAHDTAMFERVRAYRGHAGV